MVVLGLLAFGMIAFVWLGNNESLGPLDGCKNNEELKVYCDFMNPDCS